MGDELPVAEHAAGGGEEAGGRGSHIFRRRLIGGGKEQGMRGSEQIPLSLGFGSSIAGLNDHFILVRSGSC